MTKEEKLIYIKKYQLENKDKIREQRKIYYQENKEKIKIASNMFYKENKEKIAEYHKIHNQDKKEEIKIYNKKYNQENKEKKAEYQKIYYQENKEKVRLRQKTYYQENKEKLSEKQKIYNQENKDIINKKKNKYNNSSPIRKIKTRLRGRLRKFFIYKGYKKKNSTEGILGANWKTVESFMEAKFEDGMNWDNIGEWHIDHIIPLSSAETEQETIKLCHYTNLQPLWAFDNLSKGNKLDWVKD